MIKRFTVNPFSFYIAAVIILFGILGQATLLHAAPKLTFFIESNVYAEKGNTVTIPIAVSNNTAGFAAVGFAVGYDPNILEIAGVSDYAGDMRLNSQFKLTATPGTQWIHLVNPNSADWYGNGTIANVTFYVKPSALDGVSSVSLNFTQSPNGIPGRSDGSLVADAETVSGSVFVSGTAAWAPVYSVASNIPAVRGQQVNIPITVDNTGFYVVGFEVNYDPNVLEIIAVNAPVAAMPLNTQFKLTDTPGIQWVNLINPNFLDWYGDGPIAILTFNVRQTAPIGPSAVYLSFTDLPDGTPANANGDILWNAKTFSGSVTVSGTHTLTPTSVIPVTSANVGGGNKNGFVNSDNIFVRKSGINLVYFNEKDFSLLGSVRVNNVLLVRNNQYEARRGSTIVTLLDYYLDTLNTGWHRLSVEFTDGVTATENFLVFEFDGNADDIPLADMLGYIRDQYPPAGANTTSGSDNNGFIGNAYSLDETGSGSEDTGAVYGQIPQTGVFTDILGYAFVICLSVIVSIILCVFALVKKSSRDI